VHADEFHKFVENPESSRIVEPYKKVIANRNRHKLNKLQSYDTMRSEIFSKYVRNATELAEERPTLAAQSRVVAWAQTFLFGSDFSYVPPQIASLSWTAKNAEVEEHVRALDSSFLLARSIFSSKETSYTKYERSKISKAHFFDEVDLLNFELTSPPWDEWFARSCEVRGIDPENLQAFAEELLVSDHFDFHRVLAENRNEGLV